MRVLAVFAFLLIFSVASAAAPARYDLQPQESTVGFTWFFGKDPIDGSMPVASAKIAIDFQRLANTTVRVAVDVTEARAGFVFATQAMRGPRILDAARHPLIVFESTAVRPDGAAAIVEGLLTVRGVTRPVVFGAQLFRQRGTEEGDLSRISILVTGSLSRSAFGASGWSDLAGDEVRLRILARLRRADEE